MSCLFGAVSVIVYYFGIALVGDFNAEWGTYIWTVQLAGESYSFWQEYALFFTLPISALGFVIGMLVGKPAENSLDKEAKI